MSKANTLKTGVLSLILTNASLADIGDAAGVIGSAVPGNLYVGLHSADPGADGDQTTSEATYTGYSRVAIARTAGSWSITLENGQGRASNTASVAFPVATAGLEVLTYFHVGTSPAGPGKILFTGQLSASLGVETGTVPEFEVDSLILKEA